MIEIPIQYLLDFLVLLAILFLILWTALGLYLLGIKEIVAGIVVLVASVVFWMIVLSMLKIVVWI